MDVKNLVNEALGVEKFEPHVKVREIGKYVTMENYKDSSFSPVFPPSRVDSAGYVPRNTLVKRFVADGMRLDAYRHSEVYARQIASLDEEIPIDETMYMDRTDAIMEVKRLSAELASIREARNNVNMSTDVDTKKETVSSAEPTATDSD